MYSFFFEILMVFSQNRLIFLINLVIFLENPFIFFINSFIKPFMFSSTLISLINLNLNTARELLLDIFQMKCSHGLRHKKPFQCLNDRNDATNSWKRKKKHNRSFSPLSSRSHWICSHATHL